jgi:hypothetical protein
METDLRVMYDARSSFYGKARVRETSTGKQLISYSTIVAEIKNGKAIVFGKYSATTTRHQKEFLKQNGFYADNIKQMLKDYGDDNYGE